MKTVGWAFMYEVLCTCMTAPLEGLFVDKAKYSENVGHHLVCWIFVIQRIGRQGAYQNNSVATRRTKKKIKWIDAPNGTHPLTRRGDGERDNNTALKISNNTPELVTTFCETGAADVGFPPL